MTMPPPRGQRPLLFGSRDATEGYYALEESEHSESLQALSRHSEEIGLWYAGLTLYRRAMLSGWSFEGEAERLRAWNIQGQLLGLSGSTLKVGLDAILPGYYSMSFAATRHVLETCAQIDYLGRFPEEAPMWQGEPGPKAQSAKNYDPEKQASYEPESMFQLIRPFEDNDDDRVRENKLYRSWKLMCKGAHPSGEALRQTETANPQQLVFGATYHPELCSVGFDNGLFALSQLLERMHDIQAQSRAWVEQVSNLRRMMKDWRVRQRHLVDDAGGWVGPGPLALDDDDLIQGTR